MNGQRYVNAILLVGLVVALVGGALLYAALTGFTEDLRNSAIEGCERQNAVRSAERHGLRNDIAEARQEIDESKRIPPEFFPDVPPDEFAALIQQGIRRARVNIAEDRRVIHEELQLVDCEAAYP